MRTLMVFYWDDWTPITHLKVITDIQNVDLFGVDTRGNDLMSSQFAPDYITYSTLRYTKIF